MSEEFEAGRRAGRDEAVCELRVLLQGQVFRVEGDDYLMAIAVKQALATVLHSGGDDK